MTLKILLTFTLLTFCYGAWGQDSLYQYRQPFRIRDLSSKIETEQPLYVIMVGSKICYIPTSGRFSNSRQVKRAFKKFNIDSVQSIDIVKGKDATEKYGTLGKYGVIIFNMKDANYDALPRKIKRGCG